VLVPVYTRYSIQYTVYIQYSRNVTDPTSARGPGAGSCVHKILYTVHSVQYIHQKRDGSNSWFLCTQDTLYSTQCTYSRNATDQTAARGPGAGSCVHKIQYSILYTVYILKKRD
jgi:hypothetical protein